MIGAVKFKVHEKQSAILYLVGTYSDIDWDEKYDCSLGPDFHIYHYNTNENNHGENILIRKISSDKSILRLKENKRYILKIESSEDSSPILPYLQNEDFLRYERDKNSITFIFTNYLGYSKIYFYGTEEILPFEVIPDKIDYDEDYSRLVTELADHCAGLLLRYSGLTSNVFSPFNQQDPSEEIEKTLLEQFIFIRSFCYEDNILGLFEAIKRNPDRLLIQEEEFKPIGMGVPSRKFYTHPFIYSRAWLNYPESHKWMPSEVAVNKKFEIFNTPANRFIKFALEDFDSICCGLIDSIKNSRGFNSSKQIECLNEALKLHDFLQEILNDSFFEEIGSLDLFPQNNQVLQKREGYSQIFSTYEILNLALRLNWDGLNMVYEGESKDVALLYEYWLFFEIYKIIESIEGCQVLNPKYSPSWYERDNNITISLSKGKKCCQSFEFKKYGLIINLYYNRNFSSEEDDDIRITRQVKSVSESFKPDFTLAIYSSTYWSQDNNGEEEAFLDGAGSYIHFDAKYRVNSLSNILREDSLKSNKKNSWDPIYNPEDLLKMHVYNDAIRYTIGSYILYPGDRDNSTNCKNIPRWHDGILPGVGAFPIKPSNYQKVEEEIERFIKKSLQFLSQKNLRINKMKDYSRMVLNEPPVIISD